MRCNFTAETYAKTLGTSVKILPGTAKLFCDIREPSQSLVWQALSHFNFLVDITFYLVGISEIFVDITK